MSLGASMDDTCRVHACAMKAFLKSKGFKSCSTNKRLAAAYYNNKYAQEADKTGNVYAARGVGRNFRLKLAAIRARIAARRGPRPSTSKASSSASKGKKKLTAYERAMKQLS